MNLKLNKIFDKLKKESNEYMKKNFEEIEKEEVPKAQMHMFAKKDKLEEEKNKSDQSEFIPVLDKGFIRVVDKMGSDASIVDSARVSYNKHSRETTKEEDRRLIRYLLSHRHTSPFEMAEIKFHVKLPIFVARQWIRHRTANVNECSGRYIELPDEFYIPEEERIQYQSSSNKQGSDSENEIDEYKKKTTLNIIKTMSNQLFKHYHNLLGKYQDSLYSGTPGLAKELARMILPLNTYTVMHWKIDVHNLMHFLKLRDDSHAQSEIQEYSKVIYEILKDWLPLTMEAYDDYIKNGSYISSMDLEVLTDLINNNPEIKEKFLKMNHEKWTDREREEFFTKFLKK